MLCMHSSVYSHQASKFTSWYTTAVGWVHMMKLLMKSVIETTMAYVKLKRKLPWIIKKLNYIICNELNSKQNYDELEKYIMVN